MPNFRKSLLPAILSAVLLAFALGAGYGQTVDSPFVIDTIAGSDAIRNGDAAQGLLRTPAHLAMDAAGNLYVADKDNGLIRRITPAGVISTVAGSLTGFVTATGVPATDLWLSSPEGVAADANGNLYLSDPQASRIFRVAPDGISTIIAGTGLTGYSGDGGPAVQAQLSLPSGLAADSVGNLYIADTFNHRVRKITPGGTITTIAGTGQAGYSGDGGAASAATLNQPRGVAVNAAGEIFVADSQNRRVRKIAADGTISTVVGSGVSGTSGEGGPATQAQLFNPLAVALDTQGRLHVADSTRVLAVAADGMLSRVAGGGATAGTAADGGPATQADLVIWGLAIDAQNNIFVSEHTADRIRKITPDGVIHPVSGASHYQGDGGPATEAVLYHPDSVTPDGEGGFYIADMLNNVVRHVDEAGTIRTVAGNGILGFSGDGGPATQARLAAPQGVAHDQNGDLYIADSGNDRVRKVDTQGMISTFAGTGTNGSAGDGGAATAALFRSLVDVKVDSEGNVYLTDSSDNRVRVIDAAGVIHALAGTGQGGFSGDGGPATQAQLNFPSEVEVDEASGNIYIADEFNGRVRVVRPDGTIGTAVETVGSVRGIARDSDGRIYVANSNNNYIERHAGGEFSRLTLAGSRGLAGDGGPAELATVTNPQDVSLDEAGNLYVADAGNHRIRLLTAVPAIPEGGLKNAASFTGVAVAPNSIVSLFGANLAAGTAVATTKPLPTTLAGTTLTLTDSASSAHAIPLFFVSRGQINCFIPAEAALGAATLRLTNERGDSASLQIEIAPIAPGVFTADSSGVGVAAAVVLRVAGDGSRSDALTFVFDEDEGFQAVPIDLGPAGDQVYLVLFATGIGGNRTVTATVGGEAVPVLFAGAQGEFVGLDQANIGPLPRSLAGRGDAPIVLTVEGLETNTVTVQIR